MKLKVGIADNDAIVPWGKGPEHFFDHLVELRMTTCRLPFYAEWDKPWHDRLTRALRYAQVKNIEVNIVYMTEPENIENAGDAIKFVNSLDQFLSAHYRVKRIVLHNEVNHKTFFRASAGVYELMMERAIKVCHKHGARMSGMGLAASGRAGANQDSPSHFVDEVAKAYRASGFHLPLMDELSFHPYPGTSLDGWRGIEQNWLNFQLKFYQAFNDTYQPTILGVNWDETGWQVKTTGLVGTEPSKVTTEERQAEQYVAMIALAKKHGISRLMFYKLRDEGVAADWQSGLIRYDGSLRPSYHAIQKMLKG